MRRLRSDSIDKRQILSSRHSMKEAIERLFRCLGSKKSDGNPTIDNSRVIENAQAKESSLIRCMVQLQRTVAKESELAGEIEQALGSERRQVCVPAVSLPDDRSRSTGWCDIFAGCQRSMKQRHCECGGSRRPEPTAKISNGPP